MDKPFLFVDFAHPTWLLYVSLLVIAVFFRFSRLLSVRNLDVVFILLVSTTLIFVADTKNDPVPAPATVQADSVVEVIPSSNNEAQEPLSQLSPLHRWSSFVLLALSVLLIVRLTFDEALTRRPRLEQNLNQAGLSFLCIPSFVILMTSVFVLNPPGRSAEVAFDSAQALLAGRESDRADAEQDEEKSAGAPETLLVAGAAKVAEFSVQSDGNSTSAAGQPTAYERLTIQIAVVLAHTFVVLGLLYIGRRHFSSVQLGISMSCLYLLLPCTAYRVHELNHVLPAACLTWAFATYRKPALAGTFLGLACGTLFFTAFLLPVWLVFYRKRGRIQFASSLGVVAAVVITTFALISSDTDSLVNKLVTTLNWTAFRLFDDSIPISSSAIGQAFLRITLAAIFFVMLTAMTVIPRKRNLENLLANSTALVVAAQLWYPEDVGTYVLWYLPLLLLVMFRPRLDRFVPPDQFDTHKAESQPDSRAATSTGGALPRVTLYH